MGLVYSVGISRKEIGRFGGRKVGLGCEGESAAEPQLFHGQNLWEGISVLDFGATREIMADMSEPLSGQLSGSGEMGQTILVVDDVPDNLILLSLSLQDMGYRVVTAANGEDALTVAKMARPDLILMDIAMPQQDGLAATRHIREQAELSDVPVIALTAFDTEGFRQAAFDAGFNGYLTKPVDFDRLKRLMQMLLSGGRTSSLA